MQHLVSQILEHNSHESEIDLMQIICPHVSDYACDTEIFTFCGLVFCCTTSMKSSSDRVKVVSAEFLAGPW